jgi:PEP-CTERM motif
MNTFLSRLLFRTAFLAAFAFSLEASVVQVQFVNAPTGVNDGADYVLPYAITVDGVPYSAICYDTADNIVDGQTWYANELTLAQAAASGFFGSSSDALALYEEVAWLSLQSYSSAADQIDLQYNIWNVFGGAPNGQPYAVEQGPGSYSAELAAAEETGYAGFDFSRVAFLVPVDSVAGSAPGQAFVIDPPAANAPEPGTSVLLGAGLLFGIASKRRLSRGTN